MALTDEQIAALLKPKTRGPSINKTTTPQTKGPKRFGRVFTHYPEPAPGSGVTRHSTYPTSRCMSRGCQSPTGWKYKGIAYCSIHMVSLLTHELALLSTKGDNDQKEEATHTADSADNGTIVEPSSPGKNDWF